MGASKTVMVTGATGFLASWLVKKLLEKGYTVHATVRDLEDAAKRKHLLALPGAEQNLRFFKADLVKEGDFDEAIKGCHGVFHTASPLVLATDPEQADKLLIEPALKGTLNVLKACVATPNVKRVVVTSSMAAVSYDNTRPQEKVVDESCWSNEEFLRESKQFYQLSKLLAERAAWEFAKANKLDMVTVTPPLILGKMMQPGLNASTWYVRKFVTGEMEKYPNSANGLVHVEDVADAHIFLYEKPEAEGRYISQVASLHWKDVCEEFKKINPKLLVPSECADNEPLKPPTNFSNRKLLDLGFQLTKSVEATLRDFVEDLEEKKLLTVPA